MLSKMDVVNLSLQGFTLNVVNQQFTHLLFLQLVSWNMYQSLAVKLF